MHMYWVTAGPELGYPLGAGQVLCHFQHYLNKDDGNITFVCTPMREWRWLLSQVVIDSWVTKGYFFNCTGQQKIHNDWIASLRVETNLRPPKCEAEILTTWL